MSEATEKKETVTLHIPEVSCEMLSQIEAKGAAMRPRVPRNHLIVWLLEEYAAGRMTHVDESADAAA